MQQTDIMSKRLSPLQWSVLNCISIINQIIFCILFVIFPLSILNTVFGCIQGFNYVVCHKEYKNLPMHLTILVWIFWIKSEILFAKLVIANIEIRSSKTPYYGKKVSTWLIYTTVFLFSTIFYEIYLVFFSHPLEFYLIFTQALVILGTLIELTFVVKYYQKIKVKFLGNSNI